MTDFWRLFLSAIAILTFTFCTHAANAAPLSHTQATTQTTAREFFELGVNEIQHGDYQQAIANLNQAIQLQSDFHQAYSDRCLAYLHLQQYHQAIADCTVAINLSPTNAQAYLNRGLANYRQQDYPAAIADYEQAIALQPHEFRAYYNLALAYAATGNYSQSITDYNLALSQIPTSTPVVLADIYNDRGLAQLELQDIEGAMADFTMAIKLDAKDDRAYFNRGCACGRKGDNFGALRDFSHVIRLNPNNGMAYVNRGVARYQLGYYQGAIADLQTASDFFDNRGEKQAYEKALTLLKTMQKQMPSVTEVA
ncbi:MULTISPECIES: tetratricopeptide repeat protein [Calothrix]|uniref:Tetratricopeptide repeat protein n=2 Tax=Calothrix TaxID=1186 RepID=A0ABR8AFR4_9CYAN|nr:MULTISPECIES: tetratricopeptide repeat protein [Calothrix]MBD2198882.1 tetratricopeptide repeat protein [Calothrix parietina FACHB-288]MBD2227543.1 tetratricopeptide repeat protein [Calothrix anomala FACHB-343]